MSPLPAAAQRPTRRYDQVNGAWGHNGAAVVLRLTDSGFEEEQARPESEGSHAAGRSGPRSSHAQNKHARAAVACDRY